MSDSPIGRLTRIWNQSTPLYRYEVLFAAIRSQLRRLNRIYRKRKEDVGFILKSAKAYHCINLLIYWSIDLLITSISWLVNLQQFRKSDASSVGFVFVATASYVNLIFIRSIPCISANNSYACVYRLLSSGIQIIRTDTRKILDSKYHFQVSRKVAVLELKGTTLK